jgi:DNA-directed RNA polymerase specialized sigma24 family protein
VVVLRYWADLSVEQVAEVMGCSTGNVKSLSARALDKLRLMLGEAMAESGSSSMPAVNKHEPGGSRHG